MAGFGENDRYRTAMFENSNRIRFVVEIHDEDRKWWLTSIYDRFGLTPEDIGDRLSASWSADRRMEVTELNGPLQRFGITISGDFGGGHAWILERTLDFRGAFLNADRMFVDPDRRQGKTGRRFMADAVTLADLLGMKTVTLEADNIGKYAWLRCGFLPDRGSWMSMKSSVVRRIVEARDDLGPNRFAEILAITDGDDPVIARELASLTDPVRSRNLVEHGQFLEVPLGQAIFIEASPPWAGSINLDDEVSMAVLREYVGTVT
jgi:GNAT superfamily N-acetyltransferase